MDITPIPGAPLGALVYGAQVVGDMAETRYEEIRAALDTHPVLVLRGHERPSAEEFPTFGRRFGHIPETGLTSGAHPDHNEILIVSHLSEDGGRIGVGDAGGMGRHTDCSFRRGKPQCCTYTHTWQPGDIVVRDQLGTIHAKQAFDPAERRVMRQVVSIFDDPGTPWTEADEAAEA
ncbi:TauD/TfdA family dioxygenase [Streptomyces sp. NPDC058045]|uniref:TauD/TfdA dioxygenase family protein n=1 Tax=Streptomyces sp. NPDC058045 TaxID=3346311 RepID=UPI0036E47566